MAGENCPTDSKFKSLATYPFCILSVMDMDRLMLKPDKGGNQHEGPKESRGNCCPADATVISTSGRGLDNARARQIKARICEESGISERTLRRYLTQYRREGFSGLKPKGKRGCRTSEAIPPEILEQAILLRRQVPSRSISQIIQILEWEGLAEPGQIKRSTLQEKLAERGYSARHSLSPNPRQYL